MQKIALTWQSILLVVAAIGIGIVFFAVGPIAQDPAYHLFSDERALLGIANVLNVISNLPFLIVGIAGWCLLRANTEITSRATSSAWRVFFLGVTLTAFGSGYFHLDPNNQTLVWDRLPMTIAFMSLLCIVIAEYYSAQLGQKLLLPLLLVGAASVAYWALSEMRGQGDLRPYAIVQFVPMLLIPILMFGRRANSDLGPYIGWSIVFYVAAKFAEHFDAEIFAFGHWLSGHTVKHLLASLVPACLAYGLLQRRGRNVRNGALTCHPLSR